MPARRSMVLTRQAYTSGEVMRSTMTELTLIVFAGVSTEIRVGSDI
jgi:hypothetical protein